MFFYEDSLFGDENLYIANYEKDFQFLPHFHRSFELTCVRSGEITIHIDDKVYDAKEGDVIVTFPNQIHSFETKDTSGIDLVIFSPEMVGRFSSEYHGLVPVTNLLTGIDVPSSELMTDNTYLRKAVLYRVLGTLTDRVEFEPANISGDFKLIHRILSFVEQHYSESCTLKEVSRVLKYDYAYLSKQFIKAMNMSYTEYLNRFRISKACYLISRENVPISEVYTKCGFDNARSFNRNFKRYTEITPSEFKHSQRNITSQLFVKLMEG